MSKCKHCPQRKFCKDECYGENPCDFALAFDRLAHKLDLKTVCVESLKDEIRQLKEAAEEPKRYVYTEKGAAIMAKRFPGIKAGDTYDRPVSKSILKQYVKAGFIAEVK